MLVGIRQMASLWRLSGLQSSVHATRLKGIVVESGFAESAPMPVRAYRLKLDQALVGGLYAI
jgi:hypothetical protein